MGNAIDRGAALHANAHGTERRAGFAGEGESAGLIRYDYGNGNAGAGRYPHSLPVHRDAETAAHASAFPREGTDRGVARANCEDQKTLAICAYNIAFYRTFNRTVAFHSWNRKPFAVVTFKALPQTFTHKQYACWLKIELDKFQENRIEEH